MKLLGHAGSGMYCYCLAVVKCFFAIPHCLQRRRVVTTLQLVYKSACKVQVYIVCCFMIATYRKLLLHIYINFTSMSYSN